MAGRWVVLVCGLLFRNLRLTHLNMANNSLTSPKLHVVHKAINKLEAAVSRMIGLRPVQASIERCRFHSGVGVRFGIEAVLVDIFAPFLSMIFGIDKDKLLDYRERLNEVGPHTLDSQLEEARVRRNSGLGTGMAHVYVSSVIEAAESFGMSVGALTPLGFAEAVASLNRDSSSGYPSFQRQSILIDGGQLLRDVRACFGNPTSILRMPTTLWTRAQIRESGPKQRFVWGFPAVVKAFEQCMAKPLADLMRQSGHYCSGLDMPGYGGQIEELRRKSCVTISLDFSNFDQSIRAEHAYCFFATLVSYFSLPQSWVSMTSVLCTYFLSNVLVSRRGVVDGVGGLPSGSQFTSVAGSFINAFLMFKVLRDLGIRGQLTGFLVCGDDLMIGLSSDCIEVRDLARAYSKVGLTVALAKSSKVVSTEDKPINFLGFLWAFGFNFPLTPLLPVLQSCFPASRVDYHGLERRIDRVLTICNTTAVGWFFEMALVGTELFNSALLEGEFKHLHYDFKSVTDSGISRLEVISRHISIDDLVRLKGSGAHLSVQWWDPKTATLTGLVSNLPPSLRGKVISAHSSAFPRLLRIGRGVGYFDE